MIAPLFSHRFRWDRPDDVPRDTDNREVSSASADGITVVVIGMLVSTVDRVSPRRDASAVLDSIRQGVVWTDDAAGDFAVVVFDARAKRLVLTKNAAGTRPLFYTAHGDGVAVSTGFAGIGVDTVPGQAVEFDSDAVATYLASEMLQGHETLRRDVRTFPGGRSATFSPQGVTVERHWAPSKQVTVVDRPIVEVAAELREIIRTVVDDVVAVNPSGVGVHLTPGLDSTTVASLTVESCRERGFAVASAYSWQPPALPGDEQLDQRLTAEAASALGLDCSWQSTTEKHLVETLRLDPLRVPATSTLSSEIGTMRAAERDGVHTIICGWGGDELVSYNGRHRRRATLSGRLRAELSMVRRRKWRAFRRPHPGFGSGTAGQPRRAALTVGSTARETQTALLEAGHLAERTDSWSAVGARHGVRYAYPLLDRRVLDYVFSLDGSYFTGHRTLMRLVGKDLIPEAVRVNTDKSDAARSARSVAELTDVANALLADGLDDQIDPARLPAIDVERLKQAMSSVPISHPGRVTRALHFALRRDSNLGTGSTPAEREERS